jgi:hypothetical protein
MPYQARSRRQGRGYSGGGADRQARIAPCLDLLREVRHGDARDALINNIGVNNVGANNLAVAIRTASPSGSRKTCSRPAAMVMIIGVPLPGVRRPGPVPLRRRGSHKFGSDRMDKLASGLPWRRVSPMQVGQAARLLRPNARYGSDGPSIELGATARTDAMSDAQEIGLCRRYSSLVLTGDESDVSPPLALIVVWLVRRGRSSRPLLGLECGGKSFHHGLRGFWARIVRND